MEAADVLDALRLLADAGVTCWVDGGWGVDALVGRQTRAHGDLDLVVMRGDLGRVRGLLEARGFAVARDLLPTALALGDAAGREVDLHPIDPDPDGGGAQVLEDGAGFRYAPPVHGVIGGERVLCCGVEQQLRNHEGYDLRDVDHADLARLEALT